MADIVLSAEAKADFRDILQYTFDTWGADQEERYASAFERAFEVLGQSPLIGSARDDLLQGCRCYQVQQHLVFYRVRNEVVEVLRILHVRMNVGRQFE